MITNTALLRSAAIALAVASSAFVHAQVLSDSRSPTNATSDFDVVSDDKDPNGFVRNPQWYWQTKSGNEHKLPNPDLLCDGGLPNSKNCTSQVTWENLPNIPKVFICMFSLQAALIGHINWFPATYTSGLAWQEKTPDQDCNFGSKPEGNNGLTSGSATAEGGLLGLEFDSRETITQMHTSPWAEIGEKLGSGASNNDINNLLRARTGGALPFAVMTGLFGVDCEHDCHTELHPIYLIAVQLDRGAADNTWGIMIRNWGNEGFCAHGQANLSLPNNSLRLFLPHQGQKPSVTDRTRFFTNSTKIQLPKIAYISSRGNAGLLLTFTLPDPKEKGLAELELHLNWPDGSDGPSPPQVQPLIGAGKSETKVENYLESVATKSPTRLAETPIIASSIATTVRREIPIPYPIEDTPEIPRLQLGTENAPRIQHVFDATEQQESERDFRQFCVSLGANKQASRNARQQRMTDFCKAWLQRQRSVAQHRPSR